MQHCTPKGKVRKLKRRSAESFSASAYKTSLVDKSSKGVFEKINYLHNKQFTVKAKISYLFSADVHSFFFNILNASDSKHPDLMYTCFDNIKHNLKIITIHK
jgi:hypothetical protein